MANLSPYIAHNHRAIRFVHQKKQNLKKDQSQVVILCTRINITFFYFFTKNAKNEQNGWSPIEAIYFYGSHTSYNATNVASPVGCDAVNHFPPEIIAISHIISLEGKPFLHYAFAKHVFCFGNGCFQQRNTCLFRKLIILSDSTSIWMKSF